MLDKKNYICTKPFKELQLFTTQNYVCCPGWLNTPIGNDGTIKEIFFSETADKIRESVIDGSYMYCNELQCPSLSELTIDKVHEWFVPKTEENIHLLRSTTNPREINFNFDESCNFKCPSCRKDYINYKDDKKDMVDRKLKEIDEELSENIEKMYISGNSDPFFSTSFRKFLLNFDNTKYPSLKNIHIHTNGSLWNEKLWKKLGKVSPYIKTCEVSIDAGTKDTYENKTRLGGEWDVLMDNLDFICGIDTIEHISFSFVVQDTNYKEMLEFYNIIKEKTKSLSPEKWCCYFLAILNWGTYGNGEFLLKDVSNPEHVEHKSFIKELHKVSHLPNCLSNMNHLY